MRKLFNCVLGILIAILLFLSFHEFWSFKQIEQMNSEVRSMVIKVPVTDDISNQDNPFYWQIDFENLQAINPEIQGWIYVPGTNINYPILVGNEDTEYLEKDIYGNYSYVGSIFSYSETNLKEDSVIRLYGHNVISKQMFGNVTDYADSTYAKSHNIMYIYTPERTKMCQLISAFGSKWDDTVFTENPKEIMNYANILNKRSEIELELPEKNRQIYTLGTCLGYEGTLDRFTASFTVVQERFIIS